MTPRPTRAALARYFAVQLPSWGLAGALSFAAWEWFAVPAWAGALAVAAWIAKDCAMARFVANAYEGHARGGPHDLVGRRGVALSALAPEGVVRLGAERWRARCAPGVARVEGGAAVRVVAIDGLTAVVEPA